MKKLLNEPLFQLVLFVLGIGIIIFISYVGGLNEERPPKILIKEVIQERLSRPPVVIDTLNFIRISTYQAVEEQCDENPLETASMVMVTPDMYWDKETSTHGYCAVSRDLLNWHFNFHDTIYCKIENKVHQFIIIDTMNSRFFNSIDLLTNDHFCMNAEKIWYKK